MGYADRDYFREGATRPPGRLAGAPVVKWLLFLNLGVFLVGLLLELTDRFWAFGAFTVQEGFLGFQVWRLLTFQFLHADFGHLLFNSIAIYFFGAFVEHQLRSRAFLVFYLLCGVMGALGASLLGLFQGDFQWYLIGASAGVFGILVVAALIAPDMQVRLLIPPVTLTMRQLAIILLVIGVLTIVLGGRNAGGEAGHLGGALAGFLFWKVPLLRGLLENLGCPGRGGVRKRASLKIRITRRDERQGKKLRPQSRVSGTEASEVDRILDKINEHGLQVLTEEERELLARAGRK